MKDYKGMDMGQYHNNKAMKMSGVKGGKVMKSHGNMQKVKADHQKFDMGRMQPCKHESKGHMDKAFDYKY